MVKIFQGVDIADLQTRVDAAIRNTLVKPDFVIQSQSSIQNRHYDPLSRKNDNQQDITTVTITLVYK